MKIKPGGVRRLDRVLAADYLAGLERRPLGDVRSLRREAEQEETDLSYTRRLIHGRIDILRAEQRRRTGDIDNIVDHLPTVLAGEGRLPVHGLGRYTAVEPSLLAAHNRYADKLAADASLSQLEEHTDDELASMIATLEAEEVSVSRWRRAVQEVMDACSAEVARRYRDGEARVEDLLTGGSAAG